MLEQLNKQAPATEVAARRSRGAHRDTQSYRPCRRPPAAHESHTLPQPVHPNLPSAGHSPGNGSSQNLCSCSEPVSTPSGRGRPQFCRHRQLSGPVPPWMMASPWDASSWAEEWRRSEPEHRTSWPSPAPILSSATAPSSALGKCLSAGYSPAIHWCASPNLREGWFAEPSRMSHLKLTPA